MDTYEKVGFSCIALLVIIYCAAIVAGMIIAFPFGLLGLIAIIGVGSLVIKVLKERVNNEEDDYYAKNVEK